MRVAAVIPLEHLEQDKSGYNCRYKKQHSLYDNIKIAAVSRTYAEYDGKNDNSKHIVNNRRAYNRLPDVRFYFSKFLERGNSNAYGRCR